MRTRLRVKRPVLTAVVVAVGVGLSGCSESPPESSDSSETVAASTSQEADPEDVPEDDTDYSVDGGNNIVEYEYPDDPVPADSIVATLCNLNQGYIGGLRTLDSGTPVVDDDLRMNLVGFSDLLSEWDSLRPHFPEAEADMDLAQSIYNLWDRAVLSMENSDPGAGNAAMSEAEGILAKLPETALEGCSQ